MSLALATALAGAGHALITPARPAVGYSRQHGARAWLLMQEGSDAASDKLSFTEKLVKGAEAAGEKLNPGDKLSFTEKLDQAMKESGANPAYWNRQFITASHIANNVPKGSVVLELGKDAKNLYYLSEPEAATLIIPPSTQKITEGPIREVRAVCSMLCACCGVHAVCSVLCACAVRCCAHAHVGSHAAPGGGQDERAPVSLLRDGPRHHPHPSRLLLGRTLLRHARRRTRAGAAHPYPYPYPYPYP